jgi:hypothetical protein
MKVAAAAMSDARDLTLRGLLLRNMALSFPVIELPAHWRAF